MPNKRILDDATFNRIFPFKEPRKLQREVIETILEHYAKGMKHIVLSAPTGIGKSVIAKAVANYMGTAYFLTVQKGLQDQYKDTLNIPLVKGKANYRCKRNSSSCEQGQCLKDKKKCEFCPYTSARNYAYSSGSCVLNYAYFLNMAHQKSIQTARKLLVLDECTNVETELISHASLTLNKKEFSKLGLGRSFVSFPKVNSSKVAKYKWVFLELAKELEGRYKYEAMNLESLSKDDPSYDTQRRVCKYLSSKICSIERLKTECLKGIEAVIIQDKDSIEFKLVFGGSMAEEYLLDFAEYTLSMSATVFSKKEYCKQAGLKEEETSFIQCPSVFPVSNRPVYLMPVGNMSYKEKATTLPKMLKAVQLLMEQYKGSKGIIHTVNYATAEYLRDGLKSARIILPKGKNRDDQIDYHMRMDEDTVLLSPSLTEGIDLKDNLSRFTIICKVPYASLMDPWIKMRMEMDPLWYPLYTASTLVQMTGRSIRTDKDYAETYILDAGFEWFYQQNKELFPKWWKDSLKTM